MEYFISKRKESEYPVLSYEWFVSAVKLIGQLNELEKLGLGKPVLIEN
ncbi:MAG: hypothetical protein LC658_12385 [Bacteroidales bacterium]|nr:hypothetical protein [Bacteroidales bacterium]